MEQLTGERQRSFLLILAELTCMISPSEWAHSLNQATSTIFFKTRCCSNKTFIFKHFTSRYALNHLGICVMCFELIWQFFNISRVSAKKKKKQGFSSAAAVCYQMLLYMICVFGPDLLSSQRRQPSKQSYPGWWRQWWGWPLEYGPAREEKDRQRHYHRDSTYTWLNILYFNS